MKIALAALVAVATVLPNVSLAQGKKASAQGYRLPPYGMAGCGLGSLVFSGDSTGLNINNNAMIPQLLAATTNNYFFPQSSAITSGTSNCTDNPAASEEAFRIERETYISVNLGNLNKEASQGEGNHLRGLAEMIGCGSDEQFAVFASVAQTDHGEIFSDAVPAKISNRLLAKAKATDELQNCVRTK